MSEEAHQDVMMQHAVRAFYHTFLAFCSAFLSIGSLPVEAILRRNMGARYFNPLSVALSYGFVLVFILLVRTVGLHRNITSYTNAERSALFASIAIFSGFLLMSPVCSIWQFVWIARRRRLRVRCHSRYPGDSLPIWGKIPDWVGRYQWQFYIEPSLIAVVGCIAWRGSAILGMYFILAAIALFAKHAIMHMRLTGAILDSIDAQIESEQMQSYISEWKEPSAAATEGFIVPPIVKTLSKEQRVKYFDATSNLDPRLQELLGENNPRPLQPIPSEPLREDTPSSTPPPGPTAS